MEANRKLAGPIGAPPTIMSLTEDTEGTEMKNKLGDLNNHLFAEMERLGDEDLKGEALSQEIARAKAVSNVATQIINNARLVINAMSIINDGLIKNPPQMLGVNGYEEE